MIFSKTNDVCASVPDPLLLNTLSCTLLFVAVSLHKEHKMVPQRLQSSLQHENLRAVRYLRSLRTQGFQEGEFIPRGYLSPEAICPQSYPPVHRAIHLSTELWVKICWLPKESSRDKNLGIFTDIECVCCSNTWGLFNSNTWGLFYLH